MTTLVLLNPNASGAEAARDTLDAHARRLGWSVVATETPEDAVERARTTDATRVVAAGGDGTIHEIVGGLMQRDAEGRPRFGVLPLGTGNDLARTLEVPLEVEAACQHLAKDVADARTLDVLAVRAGEHTRHVLNAVNGGVAFTMHDALDADQKRTLGPLAFVKAALEKANDLQPWSVDVVLGDGDATSYENLFAVVAANGRTVGGGLVAAPEADPDSGRIDVVVVAGEGLREMLVSAAFASLAKTHESPHVTVERAQRVRIRKTAGGPFGFTLDGEPLEAEELEVAIEAGALRM